MRRRRPTLAEWDAVVEGSWTDLRATVNAALRYMPDEMRKRADDLLDRTLAGPPEADLSGSSIPSEGGT